MPLPFPRSRSRASFYHTLRMTLLPDCPFLTPLPPPPPAAASALPSPAAIVRAAVEENSLVAFVLQHLKAGLFAHIDAAAAPDNADSTHSKSTSIAALREAITIVIQRRRCEGWGGEPSCRAVAAAFAVLLQAFPFYAGVDCWMRWPLARGEPHLAEIAVRGMYEETEYDAGWPWPAAGLVADMDALPAAGPGAEPVSLTPRGRLTQEQLSPPGASDEDRGYSSTGGVRVVGGEEEEDWRFCAPRCGGSIQTWTRTRTRSWRRR